MFDVSYKNASRPLLACSAGGFAAAKVDVAADHDPAIAGEGGEFRKDPPQVLFVEHDQMIGTLAPDRPNQAFNMAVLPGRAE